MLSKKKENIVYTYEKPVEWNITGFGEENLMKNVLAIIDVLKRFNFKNPFKTIHGSYVCKYNGGRDAYYVAERDTILNRIRYFNHTLGMGVKLTFSNKSIHREQFYEEEMQWYLNVLNEAKGLGNGIICVNDDFAEMVKSSFPDLELVASHVKLVSETKPGITDTPDYYNSKFDLYDTVVMNSFRAFDDDFLSKIKHPERVEFIVNHYCTTNCQMASYHHDLIEKLQYLKIKYNNDDKILDHNDEYLDVKRKMDKLIDECHAFKYKNMEYLLARQKLNREEINYLIKNFGITKFKIEGRDTGNVPFYNAINKYIIDSESFADTIMIEEK